MPGQQAEGQRARVPDTLPFGQAMTADQTACQPTLTSRRTLSVSCQSLNS
jgi:hypothetical protein